MQALPTSFNYKNVKQCKDSMRIHCFAVAAKLDKWYLSYKYKMELNFFPQLCW